MDDEQGQFSGPKPAIFGKPNPSQICLVADSSSGLQFVGFLCQDVWCHKSRY